VQEAFNTAGILGLVACGMGVTVLTDQVCGALTSDLAAVPIWDVPERLLTVATWRTTAMTGPTKLFVDFLSQLPLQE
jgi:DNA-binding transcriptional LysR family regulator